MAHAQTAKRERTSNAPTMVTVTAVTPPTAGATATTATATAARRRAACATPTTGTARARDRAASARRRIPSSSTTTTSRSSSASSALFSLALAASARSGSSAVVAASPAAPPSGSASVAIALGASLAGTAGCASMGSDAGCCAGAGASLACGFDCVSPGSTGAPLFTSASGCGDAAPAGWVSCTAGPGRSAAVALSLARAGRSALRSCSRTCATPLDALVVAFRSGCGVAAGVSVGLATDGPMSGNTLDLFAQMAPAAMFQKIAGGSRTRLAATPRVVR